MKNERTPQDFGLAETFVDSCGLAVPWVLTSVSKHREKNKNIESDYRPEAHTRRNDTLAHAPASTPVAFAGHGRQRRRRATVGLPVRMRPLAAGMCMARRGEFKAKRLPVLVVVVLADLPKGLCTNATDKESSMQCLTRCCWPTSFPVTSQKRGETHCMNG